MKSPSPEEVLLTVFPSLLTNNDAVFRGIAKKKPRY